MNVLIHAKNHLHVIQVNVYIYAINAMIQNSAHGSKKHHQINIKHHRFFQTLLIPRTLPGDKKIIVEWKKPFEGVHGKITNYIINQAKESYPVDNHGHEQMVYNFKSNDCVNCQYEIKDLKNTVYDISVKSQNQVTDDNQDIKNLRKIVQKLLQVHLLALQILMTILLLLNLMKLQKNYMMNLIIQMKIVL